MARTASTQRNDETPARPNRSSGAPQVGHSEAVRELVAQAARLQLASLTTASRLFAGWAQSVDRFTQAISAEVLGRVRGEIASGELIDRLAVVSSTHLREVTTLPSVAVNHFNSELTKTAKSRTGTRKPARRRAAA